VAAGDAHRVWFPEMVQHLRLRWRDDLPIRDLLGLRAELDDMLGRIRSTQRFDKIPQRIWKQRGGHTCSRYFADEDQVSEVLLHAVLRLFSRFDRRKL